MTDRVARRDAAARSTSELAAFLRDGAHQPWTPPIGGFPAALGHDTVHGLDITVALGLDRRVPEDRLRLLLGEIRPSGLRFFGADISGVRLCAEDLDWSYGSGSPVYGAAQDLLLLAFGHAASGRSPPRRGEQPLHHRLTPTTTHPHRGRRRWAVGVVLGSRNGPAADRYRSTGGPARRVGRVTSRTSVKGEHAYSQHCPRRLRRPRRTLHRTRLGGRGRRHRPPDRILPAMDRNDLRAIGLTGDQRLVKFEVDRPARVTSIGQVSGLLGDTKLIGIDFRVQNGKLYGVGDQGGIYTLSTANAQAVKVSQLSVALSGAQFGIDFNPAANRLRVISDTGQNLRHNIDDATAPLLTTVDGTLTNPTTPPSTATGVTDAAYTNNDLDAATATTLFDLDTTADRISLQSPANAGDPRPDREPGSQRGPGRRSRHLLQPEGRHQQGLRDDRRRSGLRPLRDQRPDRQGHRPGPVPGPPAGHRHRPAAQPELTRPANEEPGPLGGGPGCGRLLRGPVRAGSRTGRAGPKAVRCGAGGWRCRGRRRRCSGRPSRTLPG